MNNNLAKHTFLQNHIWKDVIRIAIIAIAYFIVARLSLKIIFEPEGIAALEPSTIGCVGKDNKFDLRTTVAGNNFQNDILK